MTQSTTAAPLWSDILGPKGSPKDQRENCEKQARLFAQSNKGAACDFRRKSQGGTGEFREELLMPVLDVTSHLRNHMLHPHHNL